MPADTTPEPATDAPLKAEHHAQLAVARLARKPIDRALRVIGFSAWTLGIFAALSVPFAITGLRAAFVAVVLVVCAYFEFRGRDEFKRLDPAAITTLATNQAALGVGLVVYCLWSAAAAWWGPDPYAQAVERTPEIAEIMGDIGGMMRQLMVGFYGVVLVLGVAYQIAMVAYYRSRRKPLERYLDETPAWILALDKR